MKSERDHGTSAAWETRCSFPRGFLDGDVPSLVECYRLFARRQLGVLRTTFL